MGHKDCDTQYENNRKNKTEENLGCEYIRYSSNDPKFKVIIFKVIPPMNSHLKRTMRIDTVN